ncbi:hypothetical protein BDW22DRAFT_1364484 [Trametopsis cervina]|nr:hypothetical protein BDW22DRAFT_1364484 [Trametopsis cervina]
MTASINTFKAPWLTLAVLAISCLPGARADCFIDGDGFEHCSLSNSARIGITIAIIIIGLIAIASAVSYRQRRMRNAAIFTNQPTVNNQNVAYGNGRYPSGYDTQGGYFPNGPQYPPHAYGAYPPPDNTYGSPANPAPPAYYPPPSGPPPTLTKTEV